MNRFSRLYGLQSTMQRTVEVESPLQNSKRVPKKVDHFYLSEEFLRSFKIYFTSEDPTPDLRRPFDFFFLHMAHNTHAMWRPLSSLIDLSMYT